MHVLTATLSFEKIRLRVVELCVEHRCGELKAILSHKAHS
jgi:hypothetical protein